MSDRRSGSIVRPNSFFWIGLQRRGQLLALEVFGNQRVVGHLQAELHCQVQAGRGLALAAHAHQDHVGPCQVVVALAVVVGQACS